MLASSPLTKANGILNFLRRNIYNCPMHVKEKCYRTLVRPVLEYGCPVWDPHFNTDVEELEKVQKTAGRFVTSYKQL